MTLPSCPCDPPPPPKIYGAGSGRCISGATRPRIADATSTMTAASAGEYQALPATGVLGSANAYAA